MKDRRVRAFWVFGVVTLSAAAALASACEGDDSDVRSGFDDASVADTASTVDASSSDAIAPRDAGSDAGCASGKCVVALAVNGHDSCAVMSDSTLRCWGNDNMGELGFGTPDASSDYINLATPTIVPGVRDVKSVAVGGVYDGPQEGFVCAALGDGGVLCWGADIDGQLGRGDGGPEYADPNARPALVPSAIVQVSAYADTACALEQSGDVVCWGENGFSQIDPTTTQPVPSPLLILAATKFTQVSVGTSICAIATDKRVWCWGRSIFGSSGRFATDGGLHDFVPAPVDGLEEVDQIAMSDHGGCALSSDGVVHCFGGASPFYDTSMLGRGDVDSGDFDPNPAPVVMPAGVIFKQIAGHSYGYCALDQFGSVWCWGNNYYGANAITYADGGGVYPVWVPTKVPSLSEIVQISSGGGAMHVCTLDRNGAVKCWGYNMYDQLGTLAPDAAPGSDALNSLVPLAVVFP